MSCATATEHDAHWFTVSYHGISRIGVTECGSDVRGTEPYFSVYFHCPDFPELRMFKDYYFIHNCLNDKFLLLL